MAYELRVNGTIREVYKHPEDALDRVRDLMKLDCDIEPEILDSRTGRRSSQRLRSVGARNSPTKSVSDGQGEVQLASPTCSLPLVRARIAASLAFPNPRMDRERKGPDVYATPRVGSKPGLAYGVEFAAAS